MSVPADRSKGASGRSILGRAGVPYGKMLVVFQLSLSLMLLVAAGLFITSLNNPRGLNLGFDPNHLLLITIDPSLVGYREPKLNKRVRAIAAAHSRSPGVLSATMSSHGLVTPGADDSGFSLCK